MRFHACPPRGKWFNDPNALFHDGDRYRMLVQSRPDAPDFNRVDWGALSSDNLLDWRWDGVAIAHDAACDNYSGSVVRHSESWSAWLTINDVNGQHQARFTSLDAQAWVRSSEALGPPQRDWRDPFVFESPDSGWCMVLALPCSWGDPTGGSRLEVWRSSDGVSGWEKVSEIGPWHPPGVIWEVPLLVPDPAGGGLWSLIVSLMDRRRGGALCSVMRWRGTFDGTQFTPIDSDVGELLDHGPDFYAAMTRVAGAWPNDAPVFTGWASSWDTARRFSWGDFYGGPIALPRQLAATGSMPLKSTTDAFTVPVNAVPIAGHGKAQLNTGLLTFASTKAQLSVELRSDWLVVSRSGSGLDWRHDYALDPVWENRDLSIFIDGPLIEIHIAPENRWITCALPSDGVPLMVSLSGAVDAISWYVLPDWHRQRE